MLFFVLSTMNGEAVQISSGTQKRVVERVKEYCDLMKGFSGDAEKIDNMEIIYDICENSGISVINDLEPASTHDISNNSMQLQKYMMMITENYEHEVQTSFSGYKYMKTVVQPSPLKGFDAAVYAFVSVKKSIKTKNFNSKMSQNILVNTSTMKISSTISEDYEDPQGIYMDALEKYNNEDYDAAIPLFEKVSKINRFSGRYRAMSMQGWAYLKLKMYEKAFLILKKAAEEDPLGGIVLANEMYLVKNIPAKYQNIVEGKKLLEKYGEIRDTQFPVMHLMAKKSLIDLYMGGILAMNTKEDVAKVIKLIDELREDTDADPFHKITGLCYSAQIKAFTARDMEDIETAAKYITQAEEVLNSSDISENFRSRCKKIIIVSRFNLLRVSGKLEEGFKLLEANKDVSGISAYTAQAFYNLKKYDKALEYYKLAANEDDAFAAFVMSIASYPGVEKDYDKYYLRYINSVKADANWSSFLTHIINGEQTRNLAEHFKWLTIAADNGDVNAKLFHAMSCFSGIHYEKNRCKGVTELCEIANSGHRNESQMFIEWSTIMIGGIAKDNDISTLNCLQHLSDDGNYAADFMMYQYYDLQGDNTNAFKYLKNSSNGGFYDAMQLYVASLLDGSYGVKDTLQAYELAKQLTEYTGSMAFSIMGSIEAEHFRNYNLAISHYEQAIEENDLQGFVGMGELYEKGWGVPRDIETAKRYYLRAIAVAERTNFGMIIPEIEKLVARVDSLIEKELGKNSIQNIMATLNDLTNQKYSANKRIEMSEKILKSAFVSPNSIVITKDNTGKTDVATEKAEDFVLRLATIGKQLKLEDFTFVRNKNGKLDKLTVRQIK